VYDLHSRSEASCASGKQAKLLSYYFLGTTCIKSLVMAFDFGYQKFGDEEDEDDEFGSLGVNIYIYKRKGTDFKTKT